MVAKVNPAGQPPAANGALLEAYYRPGSTIDAEGLSSTT